MANVWPLSPRKRVLQGAWRAQSARARPAEAACSCPGENGGGWARDGDTSAGQTPAPAPPRPCSASAEGAGAGCPPEEGPRGPPRPRTPHCAPGLTPTSAARAPRNPAAAPPPRPILRGAPRPGGWGGLPASLGSASRTRWRRVRLGRVTDVPAHSVDPVRRPDPTGPPRPCLLCAQEPSRPGPGAKDPASPRSPCGPFWLARSPCLP